nr:hypothetical protein [Luteibacter yeojuensis]
MRRHVGGDHHHLVHHGAQEVVVVRYLVRQPAPRRRPHALPHLGFGAAK